MNKEITLRTLEDAKLKHLQQMEKIKLLVAHKSVETPTPLSKVECHFGQLFYGNKDSFYTIVGAQFYEKLDKLHEDWHKEYAKIYAIFFQENKNGFLNKLLGKDKIDPLQYDKAKLYYRELEAITQELVRLLDISLRRVQALSESKFKVKS